ncbi:MAG: O-antigen ligase family protein, partial [Acidobacteriota bacterium]|nr:O-antigen ligase family protein [Acidobacteriota bacterium]
MAVITNWVPSRWPDAGVQTGIFLIAIFAAARIALFGAKCPVNWLQVPFAAAVLVGLVQLATNQTVYRFQTWVAVSDWLCLLFAFSAAFQVLEISALRRSLRVVSIFFGGLIALWAILQLYSSEGQILWVFPAELGAMGPYLNYDHYAAFMELLIPVALWEAVTDRRRAVQFGCMAAVMYASVIAGASRAGSVLVNLEVAAVLIAALGRRAVTNREPRKWISLRIGILFIAFTAVVGWDALLQRFQLKDPLYGRREIWAAGIDMIRDHPWFGVGLG